MGFFSSRKTASDAAPTSSPANSSPDRPTITAALVDHLTTVSEADGRPITRDAIDVDRDLYEAGYLDSLSASQFLLLAEKQFGIKLPDWLLGGRANSVSALAEYIEGQLTGEGN